MSLRDATIRYIADKPHLQEHILPILEKMAALDDPDVMDWLVQGEAESMGLDGRDAEATKEVGKAIDKFQRELEKALKSWFKQNPLKGYLAGQDLGEQADAFMDADGDYLAFMTLRGEGVTMFDGDLDHLFEDSRKELRSLANFLSRKLRKYVDDTGGGSVNDALRDSAHETAGGGLEMVASESNDGYQALRADTIKFASTVQDETLRNKLLDAVVAADRETASSGRSLQAMVDESLIHRARSMLGIGLLERDVAKSLMDSGIASDDAYLAVKAAKRLDRRAALSPAKAKKALLQIAHHFERKYGLSSDLTADRSIDSIRISIWNEASDPAFGGRTYLGVHYDTFRGEYEVSLGRRSRELGEASISTVIREAERLARKGDFLD